MKDTALWVAIVALLISLASALFSLWSNMIAKRSLRLSEEQAEARLPNLVPYLIDGLVRKFDDNKKRIYAFSLSLSNRSDSDNSLSALELRIIYTHENRGSSNVLLPHDSKSSQEFGLEGADPFNIPTNIPAHGTIAGWTFFKMDSSILRHVSIDKYEIIFRDAHGKESNLEPIILREIFDEKKLEKN